MANYQITNKLEDSIQSSVNYKITDGLQKLEDYVSNLSIDQKRRFFNWLIGKYDIEKQDYQTLKTNHELYQTINYFIQNNNFNYQIISRWLTRIKNSVQRDKFTVIETKKILTQLKITPADEKISTLKTIRSEWKNVFLKYSGGGYVDYYNPEDEKSSIYNLIAFHKCIRKNSVEFKIPSPPGVTYSKEALPKQQFTSIVFPVLQAQYMLNWIDEEINQLQKPKPKIKNKPILDPDTKLKNVFKSMAEYQHVMEILIDKKMVHSITHRWIDEKKARRTFIACFIKNLDVLGYLDIKPNSEQIKLIAENTFGVGMSISIIDKTGIDSAPLPSIRPSSI